MRSSWTLGALLVAPLPVFSQTSIGSCGDLPAAIDVDTEFEFASSTVSCSSNTHVTISSGATLTISSTGAGTKLENVRFVVEDGATFISEVPGLEWTSTETGSGVGGAALRVYSAGSATFSEDVAFVGCSIYDDFDEPGGAVCNQGTLTFAKTATFTGTLEGGALYTSGEVTFEGDALFENNQHINRYGPPDDDEVDGGADGGAIYCDYGGIITFEGAAVFTGNEVREIRDLAAEGILYMRGRGAAIYAQNYEENEYTITFKGPVTVTGNTAKSGAGFHFNGDASYIFESFVTFEDNEATSVGDASSGGAMVMGSGVSVEFQGGVIATGNVAKSGGAFLIDDYTTVSMSSPVTITGNEARFQGGAIDNRGSLSLPADANISNNTAILCPGIRNSENNLDDPFKYSSLEPAELEFEGGASYKGSSSELCYYGVLSIDDASPEHGVLATDCASAYSTSPTLGGIPYRVLDTRYVSSLTIGEAGDVDFTCPGQLLLFVTGGGEVAVDSVSDSITVSNIRLEVFGHTKVVLSIPNLTVTGIERSSIGGAVYVERHSSLDIMNQITFLGNTLAYLTDEGWPERGGAAMYSAGDVVFHDRAFFLGNGQYEQDGLETTNFPGGAVLNIGTMEFLKKATFNDNFDVNGGNGGGMANGGTLTFNLRAIFRNNSVDLSFSDDGETYNGHGAGLFNYGQSSSVLFKRLAIFKDNVGGFRGCALAAISSSDEEDTSGTGNTMVFEGKAKFKDNFCRGDDYHNDTGGAGLWIHGASSSVEFQDTAVFKRNIAINGGAVMNAASLSFASEDKLVMADNIGYESCPDIKNYDKGLGDHEFADFGDINDPDGVCDCCSFVKTCTWYEGTLMIGAETYVGESAEICERS